MDGLPASEIAYQEAHINENRSTVLIVVSSVFTGAVVLSFIIRILARRNAGARLGLDDYLSLGATISLIGLNISACLVAHYGIGRHLLFVAQNPANFVNIGKGDLALSVCYDWSMFLGKMSVLALLARVFTLNNRAFMIGVYFWATWIFLWWIASWFIVFLECRPLSTNWGVPYQCRPSFTTSIYAAVFNIVSDVGILILPQPLIWKLQLSSGKKLAISLVFLLGTCATAISIARIPLVKGATSSANFDSTFDSVNGVLFTVLEPACVSICACLPMTWGLFGRIVKPHSMSGSSQGYIRSNDISDTSQSQRSETDKGSKNGSRVTGRYRLKNTSEATDSTEAFELSPPFHGGSYGPNEAQHFV